MARVLKGSHITCTPAYIRYNGMNHTCSLCLSSRSWYSFTDPGGTEGWVGFNTSTGLTHTYTRSHSTLLPTKLKLSKSKMLVGFAPCRRAYHLTQTEIVRRAFRVSATAVWNSLPNSAKWHALVGHFSRLQTPAQNDYAFNNDSAMPYSLVTKQLLVDLWRYGVVGKSYFIVLLQTANAICTDCYSAIFTSEEHCVRVKFS